MIQPTTNIICPITKQGCYRVPQCAHSEDNHIGNTHCAEWVLKQRKAGEKELQRKIEESNKR